MARFLHSADWQIGMTRRFLPPEAQARFAQARCDAIRTLGRVAADRRCEFLAVAGDVFESNQVDRATVTRALAALAEVPVPVFLLPGNHDPLDPATVFRSTTFIDRRPAHVHVLEDSRPVEVRPGLEVVGAPWMSKRPGSDLVAALAASLDPAPPGTVRIAVAHGAVDALSPARGDPALVSVAAAAGAIAEGRFHYLALGDRHSATSVGAGGRIRYSGTPEPTDYDEVRPGRALVVDVDGTACAVEEVAVSQWTFREEPDVALASEDDVRRLRTLLADAPARERTVLKLRLRGALPLRLDIALRRALAEARDVFAAVETREDAYAVLAEDADFAALGLAGFAADAVAELRARAGDAGAAGDGAREALALLARLAAEST